ncbi:hypothetical protein EDB83DRAFT_727401 [Lactarius deliciosus]|nr:hypothetical protein EDB83DRAFT_727401 [Lactarius deliciosus]
MAMKGSLGSLLPVYAPLGSSLDPGGVQALIVLHTMVRNGATDNVPQYLSSSDVLQLKNVSGGQWEGTHYTFPPITPGPSHFVQVIMHLRISSIILILTRAYVPTGT